MSIATNAVSGGAGDMASPKAPEPVAVKIKALKWERSGWVEAFSQPDGLGIWYSISPYKPVHGPGEPPFSCRVLWGVPNQIEGRYLGESFQSVEAAKAAGQADFNTRSLANIELVPVKAQDDLVEALRGLIAAVGDWSRPTGANGMTSASPSHPLNMAATKGRTALAAHDTGSALVAGGDETFDALRHAYKRGYEWAKENGFDDPFIGKAAYDYADTTTSQSAIRALQTAPAKLDDETRQVLDTFAAVLDEYDPTEEADETPATLVVGSVTNYDLTLGDFRAARELLGRR